MEPPMSPWLCKDDLFGLQKQCGCFDKIRFIYFQFTDLKAFERVNTMHPFFFSLVLDFFIFNFLRDKNCWKQCSRQQNLCINLHFS